MTSIVDTNVILVANGQHDNIGPDCVIACSQRLQGIMAGEKIALDDSFEILLEYQNKQLLSHQHGSYNPGPLEGFVIRHEDHDWLLARAKLVHPGFTQAIDKHWSRRGIEWNRVDIPVPKQRQTIPRSNA